MFNKATLAKFSPFSELPDRYIDEIEPNIEVREFAKGEILFKRGKLQSHRFFLTEGEVNFIDRNFVTTTLSVADEKNNQALNIENPSLASCVAKSDVTVLVIEVRFLDRVLTWSQSEASVIEEESAAVTDFQVEEVTHDTAIDWMSRMLQAPLFTKIPMAQVQELFLKFENWNLEQGETVIREGEPGDYFYVLAKGRAHLTNRVGSVDLELGPGDFFGEEALLGATTRNATVTMLTSGALKRLDSKNFAALLKEGVLKHIAATELDSLNSNYEILDVKMPIEYRAHHHPGSRNIPLSKLRQSRNELDQNIVYLVSNDAGSRAEVAAHLLCQAGFDAAVLDVS